MANQHGLLGELPGRHFPELSLNRGINIDQISLSIYRNYAIVAQGKVFNSEMIDHQIETQNRSRVESRPFGEATAVQ